MERKFQGFLSKARYIAALAVLILGLVSIIGTGGDGDLGTDSDSADDSVRPVVFVHGFYGNAAQFESQAQRFMANDYPQDYLEAYEHATGPEAPSPDGQTDGLDEVIDDVLQRTGHEQVDLIGHSRGAGLCAYYLEDSPERAEKVAHFVPVDSQTVLGVIAELGLTDTPGDVPTLAIWGEGDPGREVPGAANTYIDDQAHIERCTSAESFVEMYEFFNDSGPETDQIMPQPGEEVLLEGAVNYFPANEGAPGTLEIWEIDPVTGQRLWAEPEATWEIDETGAWGPQSVNKGATYEFAFEHSNGDKHYFYREPFWADNFFIRLDTSDPEADFNLGALMPKTANHTDILIKRDKELWGDQGEGIDDVLIVDGENIFDSAGGAAAAARTKRLSGLFLMDWGPDNTSMSVPGVTNEPDQITDLTEPISAEDAEGIFHSLPFMSGLDLFMSADNQRTVNVELTPRGGDGAKQTINVPAWPSNDVRVTVHFRDFVYPRRPVVFVHGYSGSASQFESQAQRFMANGYPVEHLAAYEHNTGTDAPDPADQVGPLEDMIDDILFETGADQVNLIGHSRGTRVSQEYLADPERAAKVARYVNVDGAPADEPPGGLPTLALWGDGILLGGTGEIAGARNIYHLNQSHIQVATSKESFVDMFKFFTGSAPVVDYIPQASGETIEIAGKVSYFPANVGASGTLEIWEIDPYTAQRLHTGPEAAYTIGTDGDWGPLEADKGATYEFAFEHSSGEKHYFYREPNIAENYFIRLNTSDPDDPESTGNLLTKTENHTDILITRDKELWGNQDTGNDVLVVDGTDIFNTDGGQAAAAREQHLSALFLMDWGPDNTAMSIPGVTNEPDQLTDLSEPISAEDAGGIFHSIPFMSGLDLYMETAADEEIDWDRVIDVELTPRGGGGRTQSVTVPNRRSSNARISVHFRDFVDPAK